MAASTGDVSRNILSSSERSTGTSESSNSVEGRRRRGRPRGKASEGKGRNDATCYVCRTAGLLILCDTCSASYHPICIGLDKEIAKAMEDGWKCPICTAADDGTTVEDREGRLVRILRRQKAVKKLWIPRASMQPFSLDKYLVNLLLGSEEPIPMETESALGGLDEYPLVKSARIQACQNALQYVSKRFLEGGLARGATEVERVDFVEYAADVAYLCTNICLYSADMDDELMRLGKQLLRRWTEMVKEETKDLSVDPHFVMSFAEYVVACRRLGMYDDPTEGLSFDRDIAMLKEATEEAGVASLVCAGKFASAVTGPDAPLDQGKYPSLCTNCGEDLGASRVVRWRLGRCLRCHWPVTKTVPYGDLVESLVWPSLYEELGVCFVPEREIVFDTLRIIRRLRPYRHPQDIGLNAWKLQAYLITHVLYVLSEWGSQPLSSTTLHYEYDFVNEALALCMGSIDDPELGGELVQCLRIFDAGGGGEDTAISRRVSAGVCYLLSRESSSEPGRWTRGMKPSIYDDYHTTMCVLVGLSQPKTRPVTMTAEMDKHWTRVHEWLAFMEDEEPHPYDQTYEVVRAESKQPRTKNGRIGSSRRTSSEVLDDCNIVEYTKIAAERRKALASLEASKRRRRKDTTSNPGSTTVVKEDDLKGTESSSLICSSDKVVPQNQPSHPARRKRGPVQCGICGCSFSLLREAIRCAECRLAVHAECLPRSELIDLKKTEYLCPLCLMISESRDFGDGLRCSLCRGPINKGQYLVAGHVYSSHDAEQTSIQQNKDLAHCPCALQCALFEAGWFKLLHNSTDGSIEFEVLDSCGDFSISSETASYELPATQSSKCCYCLEPLEPLTRVCVQQCSRVDCYRAWHVGCNPPKSYLLFADEHEARTFSHYECGSRH